MPPQKCGMDGLYHHAYCVNWLHGNFRSPLTNVVVSKIQSLSMRSTILDLIHVSHIVTARRTLLVNSDVLA